MIKQKNNIDLMKNSKDMLDVILGKIRMGVIVYDVNMEEQLFINAEAKNCKEMSRTTDWLEREKLCKRLVTRPEGTKVEHFDAQSGVWIEIKMDYIEWIDGTQAVICIESDITLRKKNRQKIEYQSHNDALTGLFNRKKREDDVRTIISACVNNNSKAALITLDLDDFKIFNESLGQQFGDALLQQISAGLKCVPGLRYQCYRIGGDEFSIIVTESQVEHLERIIKNISRTFNEPWNVLGSEYFCTASMGIAIIPDDGCETEDIVKKSEMAMVNSKTNGKNTFTYYESKIFDDKKQYIDLESNLRQAVVSGMTEFSINYQPVIDLKSLRCSSCEALVRWNSGTLGFVSPAEFIPIAESTGLITEIGSFVFETACRQCKEWNETCDPSLKVNINMSVVQLMQNDILNEIQAIIMSTGVNPHNIVVEITESFAINDMGRVMKIITGIKNMGMQIALDDFGTGYSSLSYIKKLPLDIIKVDKTFIDEIVEDGYAKAFVHAIVELSNSIGTKVVVEGVEEKEQLEHLTNQGVNFIQGYLFGKPVTAEIFTRDNLNKTFKREEEGL